MCTIWHDITISVLSWGFICETGWLLSFTVAKLVEIDVSCALSVLYSDVCHFHVSGTAVEVLPIKASSLEEAVQEIEKTLKTAFTKQILVTEREPSSCQEGCLTVKRANQC
jgi:hypothetical protein